jgi:hypothetical protein
MSFLSAHLGRLLGPAPGRLEATMPENDRAYECRRALDEMRAMKNANREKASNAHFWLLELHQDRCRKLGDASSECEDCPFRCGCIIEKGLARQLHQLSDAALIHLWRTISNEDANGPPGATISNTLIARGITTLSETPRLYSVHPVAHNMACLCLD